MSKSETDSEKLHPKKWQQLRQGITRNTRPLKNLKTLCNRPKALLNLQFTEAPKRNKRILRETYIHSNSTSNIHS